MFMCQVNTQAFDKVATRENNQSLYIYIYMVLLIGENFVMSES